MQFLGINIQRNKTLAAAMAALTKPAPVDDDPTKTESVKFAEAYAAGSSKEMLDTLGANRTDAELYTKIALYLSIPHQALFLLTKVELHQSNNPLVWLATGFGFTIALGLPFLIDRGILMFIRNLTVRAASTASKWVAGLILLPLIVASMFLNFSAPGPDILKFGAASLSLLAAIYQVARMVRPDFRKVGESERQIADEVAEMRNGPAAATAPQPGRSGRATRRELQKRRDAAVDFANRHRGVTVRELMKQTACTRDWAKQVLANQGNARTPQAPPPANVPTSPAHATLVGSRP